MRFVFHRSLEQHTPGVGNLPGQSPLKAPLVAHCLLSRQSLQMASLRCSSCRWTVLSPYSLLIPKKSCKIIIIYGTECHGEIPRFSACARTGIPVTGVNPLV